MYTPVNDSILLEGKSQTTRAPSRVSFCPFFPLSQSETRQSLGQGQKYFQDCLFRVVRPVPGLASPYRAQRPTYKSSTLRQLRERPTTTNVQIIRNSLGSFSRTKGVSGRGMETVSFDFRLYDVFPKGSRGPCLLNDVTS